jgi:DNA repair photolyase
MAESERKKSTAPAGPAGKLLKPADLPENFTRSLYKIAPYRGCGHGCRYCDGRAERYYVEGDFERDVEIRDYIPDRLAKELPGIRERGMVSFGSGVTDPYQPLEGEGRITARCATLLADAPNPIPAQVMTKSSLPLRDLPVWKRLNERSGFVLLVSLTSLDESLREVMEPGAAPFAERLAMLREFKAAGCATGVLAMPFLPGISDAEPSIRALYEACAQVGVDFVMPGGLTLRPGRQKDFYLKALESYRPELVGLYRDIYCEERPSGAPTKSASSALAVRIDRVRREFSLPYLLPYQVYSRFIPKHDALWLLFRDMLELYKERGVDTSALERSSSAYGDWLLGMRRHYRRHRTLPTLWLEERFDDARRSGELDQILANAKLSRFVASILEGGRFDYLTLSLES